MLFPVVPKLSLFRSVLSGSATVPWSIPFGDPVAALPKQLPLKLRDLVNRRSNDELGGQIVDRDFFSNNGILLAVPKKKVSHQKKRQKLYGPGSKQLKMIHHLNKCPSCGHYKSANTLCMHCVEEIRHIWKNHTLRKPEEPLQEQQLSELDKRILYPGKKETEYTEKLKNKGTYLERRLRSLPVSDKK